MHSQNLQTGNHLTPREQELYFALVHDGMWVVSTQDTIDLVGVSHGYARKILSDLNGKHALVRAGQGVYVVAPPETLHEAGEPPVDPFKVLDQLMRALDVRYYAAYMTAAYLHGGAHQLPQNIAVATPDARRPVRLGPTRITFHRVPEERLTGTVRVRNSGEYLTVSDIEKTLVDCADRFDLCGGADGLAQIIWELGTRADARKLRAYAMEDGRNPVIQRLGYILAHLARKKPSRVPRDLHKALRPLVGERAYLLDPAAGTEGELDDHWNIRVNTDILGWLHA